MWTFLRTDVTHQKQQVLAVRPEAVSSIRPATVGYVKRAVKSPNIGVEGQKRDFFDEHHDMGVEMKKVYTCRAH